MFPCRQVKFEEACEARTIASTPCITTEALMNVATFLAGDQAYRTLADLSQASKRVHRETLPILYEKVVWEKDKHYWVHDGARIPEGYAYTRFLLVNESSYTNLKNYQRYLLNSATDAAKETPEDQALRHLFPNLMLIVLLGEPKRWPKTGHYSSCTVLVFEPVKFDEFLEVIVCGKDGRSTGIRDVYLHQYASLRHGHHYQIANIEFVGEGEVVRDQYEPRLCWQGNVVEWDECEDTGREVASWSKKGYLQIANFETTGFADLHITMSSKLNGSPLAIFDHLTLVPASRAWCGCFSKILNAKITLPQAEGLRSRFPDQFASLSPFRFRNLEIHWKGRYGKDAFEHKITTIVETIFAAYVKDENATKVDGPFPAGTTTIMVFTADGFPVSMSVAVKLMATVKVQRSSCDAPISRLLLNGFQGSTVIFSEEYTLKTTNSD